MERTRYCIEIRDEWTASELEEWLAEAATAVGHADFRAEVHGLAGVEGQTYAEVSLTPPGAIPAVLRMAATAGRALGWLDPPGCDPEQRDPALPLLDPAQAGFTPARWDAAAQTWQLTGFVPCAAVHYVLRKTAYFRFSVLRG
jgi:hypothetical protein